MKTLFYNGRVFTGTGPLQQAFTVEEGRFVQVGQTEELLSLPHDQNVDLQGRFVCPGFIDSHMHLMNLGNTMEMCNLAGCDSLTGLQQRLAAFLQERALEEGQWLLGRGWNQDYFSPATGMPTRQELDDVSTAHPICIVRCCGHVLSVNSRALALLQLDETTPCPPGGSMDLGPDGRLNGIFRDAAMPLVQGRLPVPDVAAVKRMLQNAMAHLNAVGVTSCHTDDLLTFENLPWQQVIQAYRELEAEGGITVRVYEQSQFTTPAGLQAFLDAGYKTGVGSPYFKIGPLKLLGDGSLGARTARLSQGYADAPGEKGLMLFSQQDMDNMLSLAHQNGMQCAVHVIGDGVLDQVLAAYEKAFAASPRADHRSSLIHLQLTRPDQLQRIRALQLHAYVQSVFLDYDCRIVHSRAGQALAATSYPFRSLKAMGLHASNGTDCPVENPHPLRGIQCAVTRQPLDGSLPPYRPEESASVESALLSYTKEGAYASFEETLKGQIAPGFLADFVVLDQDPFVTPPSHLHEIQVLATFMDGRNVFIAI